MDDSLAPDLADAHAFLIKRTKQPGSPYHAATPGGRSRQLLLGDGAGDGGSARVVDPSGLSIRVHDGDVSPFPSHLFFRVAAASVGWRHVACAVVDVCGGDLHLFGHLGEAGAQLPGISDDSHRKGT